MLIKVLNKLNKNYYKQILRNSSIQVGSKASIEKKFTLEDVKQFANLSLDYNEVHLDLKAANESGFKKQIVHGILINGLVSAILGTILPGKGSILMNENISFLKPVYIDNKVKIEVEIMKIIEKREKTYFDCSFTGFIINDDNQTETCVKGSAKLLKRKQT